MVAATAQCAIRAPAEIVFAVATDPDRMEEWQSSVRSIRRLDRGAVGVGSRLSGERLVAGVAMPFTSEVTAWQPPHLCTFEASGRGVLLRGEQRVTPLGLARSQMTARLELDRAPVGVGWLGERVNARVTRALQAELQSLAALIEREASP